jgi:hypothetical protein
VRAQAIMVRIEQYMADLLTDDGIARVAKTRNGNTLRGDPLGEKSRLRTLAAAVRPVENDKSAFQFLLQVQTGALSFNFIESCNLCLILVLV